MGLLAYLIWKAPLHSQAVGQEYVRILSNDSPSWDGVSNHSGNFLTPSSTWFLAVIYGYGWEYFSSDEDAYTQGMLGTPSRINRFKNTKSAPFEGFCGFSRA